MPELMRISTLLVVDVGSDGDCGAMMLGVLIGTVIKLRAFETIS